MYLILQRLTSQYLNSTATDFFHSVVEIGLCMLVNRGSVRSKRALPISPLILQRQYLMDFCYGLIW